MTVERFVAVSACAKAVFILQKFVFSGMTIQYDYILF